MIGRWTGELMLVLEGFRGTSAAPDTIRWTHENDDMFTVNRINKKEAELQSEN